MFAPAHYLVKMKSLKMFTSMDMIQFCEGPLSFIAAENSGVNIIKAR